MLNLSVFFSTAEKADAEGQPQVGLLGLLQFESVVCVPTCVSSSLYHFEEPAEHDLASNMKVYSCAYAALAGRCESS